MLGQAAGDFVEQQNARPGRQRACEFQPLAIEQREAAGAKVGLVGQRAAIEQFRAAVVDRGLAFAGSECRRHHNVLEHGHAGKRLRDLERAREAQAAAALGRSLRDVLAGEQHAAGVGRDGAGGDTEQRGLAGAIRPDDAERLAVAQREVDSVRNHHGPEPLRDVVQRKDRGHGLNA